MANPLHISAYSNGVLTPLDGAGGGAIAGGVLAVTVTTGATCCITHNRVKGWTARLAAHVGVCGRDHRTRDEPATDGIQLAAVSNLTYTKKVSKVLDKHLLLW